MAVERPYSMTYPMFSNVANPMLTITEYTMPSKGSSNAFFGNAYRLTMMYLAHSSEKATMMKALMATDRMPGASVPSSTAKPAVSMISAMSPLSIPRKKLISRCIRGSRLYSSRKKKYRLMAIPGAIDSANRTIGFFKAK